MNLIRRSTKNRDPFFDFFDLDSPHWGLSLLPVWDKAGKERGFFPSVDVSEEKNHVVVKADLPGVDKGDITLSAEGSVLTIRGEKKLEEEKKEKHYHRIERSYGVFERSFDVGTLIDEGKVKAKYKDGVLEVIIPKTEDKPVKRITIDN